MSDYETPQYPKPAPPARAVMGQVVEHAPSVGQAAPNSNNHGPQTMELIIMLVLIALVAWACYLLYYPQIEGMILTMLGAAPGPN